MSTQWQRAVRANIGGCHLSPKGPRAPAAKKHKLICSWHCSPGSPLSQPESTEPHTSHFLSGSLSLDCVNCCQPARVRQQVKYKDTHLPISSCHLSTCQFYHACPVQPPPSLPLLGLPLSSPYSDTQPKSTFSAKATRRFVHSLLHSRRKWKEKKKWWMLNHPIWIQIPVELLPSRLILNKLRSLSCRPFVINAAWKGLL